MVADALTQLEADCAAVPLDNGVKVGDGPPEVAPAALDFLPTGKMGETMSADNLGGQKTTSQVGVLAAGSVVALDAAQHAEYVTQQMMALAENIETLLQGLEAAQLRARHLRERWGLSRQQLQRSRPVQQAGMSAAAFERALATWQERMTQAQRDVLAEEQLLRTQMQRTREQLQQVQQELRTLQDDALPAAMRRDTQQRVTQLVEQQHQLERELDALHAELLAQEIHKQAHDAMQTQSAARAQSDVQQSKTGLGTAANSNDDDMLQSVAELTQDQREQLTPIVQLVGSVLQSQRGGNRAAAKLAGASTVPISAATAVLQSRWGDHISKMNVDGWMDVNQLIQWVMREAYINNTEDLRTYAYRVKFFTDLKRSIREELTRARNFQRENTVTEGGNTRLSASYDMRKFSTVPNTDPRTGALAVRAAEGNGSTDDPKTLDNYLKELDQLLNTVGDDAQLAQVDLQNVTQKQQQTLQTLSNLSKVLHETSMAIIRKIGS